MSLLRWCKKLLLMSLLLSLAMCKQAPKNGRQEAALGPDEKDSSSETVLISEGHSAQAVY